MCCRYWADDSPEIREIVEKMNRSPLVEKWRQSTGITTYGEIRPTNVVPVIASRKSGEKGVFPMKWGFSGRTLLMNARVETAAARPTFKEAWESHRCIVPASWYFEWEHIIGNDGRKQRGDKYLIQPKGSAMTSGAGSESASAAFSTPRFAAAAHVSFTYMRLTPDLTAAFGL